MAVVVAAIAAACMPVAAFDLSAYAGSSVLASGRWVKVSVPTTGLYMITTAQLRQMGFSDPSRVRVHGYGGARIPDVLSRGNYVDDLPQAPQQLTDRGIVFYAVGPDVWERSSTTAYYHKEQSPYTTVGYYYVGETADADAPSVTLTTGTAGSGTLTPADRAQARLHHEQELTLATVAGPLTVGEDFRFTPSRKFNFDMPGRVDGTTVWMECQFVATHVGVTSNLLFEVDGKALPAMSTDRVAATSDSHYVHASIATTRRTFLPELTNPERMTVTLSHSVSGVATKAHLDYLSVNYTRSLQMPAEGYLEFWANERALALGGATQDLVLWDVTVATSTAAVNYELQDGRALWQPSTLSMRSYVAWRPGATLPAPAIVGTVATQDLHGDSTTPDMVIFAPSALLSQARRIAELHSRIDTLTVKVVDVAHVYNEFSSGAPDVSGLRKYLKMLYDRGIAAGHRLHYALLLGRTTLDNRGVTSAPSYCTLPAWVNRQARQSMSDNDGFTTDDFIAMLGDNSGSDMGLDDLQIAVGRIPMTSEASGVEIVDKLSQYALQSRRTPWKNRILVVADDEDQGIHLRQAEAMVKNFLATDNQQHIVDKVYLDAYLLTGGEYPDARREMFGALDEGAAWWFFTGHANDHSWTGEGQLTYTDINNMYLRNLPFVFASTCDFLRWDAETESGGEIMYKERYGGGIAMVSATRPVYITDNGYYLEAVGRALLSRDADGHLPTPGEMYRRSKNNILNSAGKHVSNTNRLRFVFMGDPAMPVVTPDNIVHVLTINGREASLADEVTIAAMSGAVITGCVTGPDGTMLDDFNGVVYLDIYDATRSVTTNGNGNGRVETFDRRGDKLFAGSATVRGGEFTINVAMPQMVADNWRPATMSLYAAADNSQAEAVGVCREFYVYGFEEPAVPDTIPPVIESLYVNHDGFTSGGAVNSSPVVKATVRDNVGINLSSAGVGHQMTITLDGITVYSDVASSYTPASDGTPSGSISYGLDGLSDGAHSLRLRVFDTSGNMTQRELDIYVDDNVAPQIFEVFTDANPASEQARFYVRHDRPENIVEVSVEVFDLLGHPVWTGSSKGMSDNDLSSPVTWDLTDGAGRRVNRGIYLYRATITTDNAHYETASRRIAVTAR